MSREQLFDSIPSRSRGQVRNHLNKKKNYYEKKFRFLKNGQVPRTQEKNESNILNLYKIHQKMIENGETEQRFVVLGDEKEQFKLHFLLIFVQI